MRLPLFIILIKERKKLWDRFLGRGARPGGGEGVERGEGESIILDRPSVRILSSSHSAHPPCA